MSFEAIVLAGGRGTRLGGVDKAELVIGGMRLMDRVLASLRDAERIVVVGPRRASEVEVTWVQEAPPGGGPVAAVAAALPFITQPAVAIAAVDHAGVRRSTWTTLLAELARAGADGVVVTDGDGRDQPLVGVYVTAKLSDSVAHLDPGGAAMQTLLQELRLGRVTDLSAAHDIDTPEDLAEASR